MTDEIGIRSLESGKIARVWLRPNSPSGTVDDLENPRRWRVVSNTKWKRNESDSYFHDEEKRRVQTRSVTYKAIFSPIDSNDDERFTMEYTIHRDGYTEYSPVTPEKPYTPAHNIGRIARIETE